MSSASPGASPPETYTTCLAYGPLKRPDPNTSGKADVRVVIQLWSSPHWQHSKPLPYMVTQKLTTLRRRSVMPYLTHTEYRRISIISRGLYSRVGLRF